jgi:hypothetical protein
MNVKSNALPLSRVDVNTRGNKTTVTLWDGSYTESSDAEGNAVYSYDVYQKTLRARKDFADIITGNFKTWYDNIKSEEYESFAAGIRAQRDKLLSSTDWTQTLDAPITSDSKTAARAYRQALRDITGQSEFPYNVIWPEKPGIVSTAPEPVDVTVNGIVDVLSTEFGVIV